MINRMLNGGITEVENELLIEALETVDASENASREVRKTARDFIAYQSAKQ